MIFIKSESEIKLMREAGKIVGNLLLEIQKLIKPGVKTIELDKFAEEFIRKYGAVPSFKGYKGYPFTLCTCVNESIVHEMPSTKVLREGDIIGIDAGACYKGYHADAAKTFPVGEVSKLKKRLIQAAEEALKNAIKMAKEGNRVLDISHAIELTARKYGFSPARDYTGHGIGRALHEDPPVPTYGPPGKGPLLRKGMTLAIEAMINAGKGESKTLKDGWTAITVDRKPSALFEHTIVIREDNPEILTLP